ILMPTSQSSSGSLSRLASQLGGIAPLIGVQMQGSENKSLIALELMKTWGFLESFIERNKLQVEVYGVIGWDESKNELVIDKSLYDVEQASWVELDSGESLEPTSWDLFETLADKIQVSVDDSSGLVSISVEHYSPHVAKKMVELLVVSINRHMQALDKEEAIKSIKYLKAQIGKTNIAEMHSIFYELIEEQTKKLMLAEVSEEYVFKVLSQPKIAEKKSKPKRALMLIMHVALASVISIIFVIARNYRP
ncbi:MAG: hypothetical protein MI867_11540, partial [Pseudomonadales bacterium]|nr:hypothetical protein [Pseudomonadales bacterium]